MAMKIGNLEVGKPVVKTSRMALLLWGSPNCGKTTLACTGPGEKLLINLDPEGPASIADRKDVHVVDLSNLSNDDVMKYLESDNNPLGLNKFLEENPKIKTVILDSSSALSHRALEVVVAQKIGASQKFTPTMKVPGITAYGGRNAIVLTCLRGLLRVTGRHSVHCIICAHEDDPEKDKDGNVLYISIMLGGKLVTNFNIYLSEIWYMSDAGGKNERRLAVRPCRNRKPMKTRMFVADSAPEFTYVYNYGETPEPLATWWDAWVKGGGKKMSLPSTKKPATSNSVRTVKKKL